MRHTAFRRVRCLAAAALALCTALGAQAQGYPTKPITLVVPFAAGGAADVLARLLAQQTHLGQPLVIENRVGAGGTLGAAIVAKAPADGQTLLFVTAGHAGTEALYPKLSYSPSKDLVAVAGLATAPIVFVVNATSNIKTMDELVAQARQHPNKLNCAGGGGGATVTNLALEAWKSELKLRIGSIPYRGSAPAVTALLGNEIDCDSDAISTVLPYVKSGKLRALAVSTAKRSALLPDVKTIGETVLPKFQAAVWYGLLAPKGTPQPVIDKLNHEFLEAMKKPGVADRMKELGLEPTGVSPREFQDFVASETRRWGGIITALGLKPE